MLVAPHVLAPYKPDQSNRVVRQVAEQVAQQVTKMMISAAHRLKVAKQFANY
jgi:hypothetical protein